LLRRDRPSVRFGIVQRYEQLLKRSAAPAHQTCRVGRILVIGLLLGLAAVGCGGGDGQSAAEQIRSVDEVVDEELSTLPDLGPGLGEASPPPGLRAGWRTDFSKRSVSLDEFMSGGPAKDGIPAVDDPKFVAVEDADFLEDREPVIELVLDGDARAYPIQILIWHEIVNDVVAGVPVAVTFCPLCNTAIAFGRRLDRQTLDFGTTGYLRESDLVMYDRQTESWWQQFGGEALVGELTGARLEQLPSRIVAWADFRREHAGGKVLSRDTGFARPYGENPYVGYDSVDSSPIFPTRNADDKRLPPKERVAFIERDEEAVVVPFSTLREKKVVRVEIGGRKLLVRWRPGLASSLDEAEIAAGRDTGAVEVRQGGRLVSFDQPFWFAVAAFRPDIRIVR
jgi:Protein of unknown function (DUF3179)